MPGSQSPLQVISSNLRDQTNLIAVANGKEGHGQNDTLAVFRHDKASLGGQLWGQMIRANDKLPQVVNRFTVPFEADAALQTETSNAGRDYGEKSIW